MAKGTPAIMVNVHPRTSLRDLIFIVASFFSCG
jgi:hypothetical protein